MKKLKLLWFLLVPLGWFLAFQLTKWVQFYPSNSPVGEPTGLDLFLAATGIFGTLILILGSVGLAIYLQE